MSEEFQMLLEHGADPNASLGVDNAHHFQEYLRGTTAFMRACADRAIEALQWMLDAGADLAAADREGQTAVGIALRFGNTWGSALHDASRIGADEIIDILLTAGADVDAVR